RFPDPHDEKLFADIPGKTKDFHPGPILELGWRVFTKGEKKDRTVAVSKKRACFPDYDTGRRKFFRWAEV
ncbi:MAG: hypothetical protein ACOC4K_02085, partial [Verrucomicrobiota bacterium]